MPSRRSDVLCPSNTGSPGRFDQAGRQWKAVQMEQVLTCWDPFPPIDPKCNGPEAIRLMNRRRDVVAHSR